MSLRSMKEHLYRYFPGLVIPDWEVGVCLSGARQKHTAAESAEIRDTDSSRSALAMVSQEKPERILKFQPEPKNGPNEQASVHCLQAMWGKQSLDLDPRISKRAPLDGQ